MNGHDMRQNIFAFTTIIIFLFTSCSKDKEDPVPVFDVNPDTLIFSGAGGEASMQVNMDGKKWVVSSNQDWCSVSINSSTIAYVQVKVTSESNPTGKIRSARLTFIMDAKDTVYVGVGQKPFYPDYSDRKTPDASGMGSNSIILAKKMFAGWNLGNSLEVPADETAWGNPKTTQRLIDSVKARGINTIRIPCAWNSYIEDVSTCKLKSLWLDRIKEVVDYCFNNGMFVIINIHWDGGWLENNPTYDKQIAVIAKQKALWEQIAVKFRDYDEHLLFAGTNEVHTEGNATSENYIVQMSYNETFVDAVRSTGGKNTYRNLIIQAYNTNIDMAVSNLVVPDDSADDRLLVEVHYYDPWDFCGLEADATWGTVKYLWGTVFAQYGTISTWGQEDYVRSQFKKMKTSFVDKGYPVILGEFGAIRRLTLTGSTLEHHLASRAYYFQYVAQQAKNHGLVPIIWDNGYAGNLGSAIFKRSDGSVLDSLALNAFVAGASSGTYPF